MSSIPSSVPRPTSRLWNRAVAVVRDIAGRLVVPVTSTDEMSDVWKLYRLTPAPGPVRPEGTRELGAGAGR